MFRSLRPVGNSIAAPAIKVGRNNPTEGNSLLSDFNPVYLNSGTEALALAIQCVIEQHPEIKTPSIILPAYTCPDLLSAIHYCHAQPILVDFEQDTFWIDLKKLEESIRDDTVAIIAVNFLGIPERIEQIKAIISDKQITLIEDSAQGMPYTLDKHYWKGDIAIISFGRGKPVSLARGGATLLLQSNLKPSDKFYKCQKNDLLTSIKTSIKNRLFNLILNPFIYYWFSRIFSKKLGKTIYKPLFEIKKLDCNTINLIQANFTKRQQLYNNQKSFCLAFEEIKHPLFKNLGLLANDNMQLLRYPILIKDKKIRESLYKALKDLGCSLMYDDILPNIEGTRTILGTQHPAPYAEKFSEQLLTFPLHEDLLARDIRKIARTVNQVLQSTSSTSDPD